MESHVKIRNRVLIAGLATAFASTCACAETPADDVALQRIIADLDTAVFDAFNRCSEPGQLDRHADHFDEKVEFYHDTGGVTWTRDAMLENTRKHVCGNFRRELVAGSLKVFPIRGFGAIAQGAHRFCPFDSGSCDGLADFTMVWRHAEGAWRITRVLSYGHRAAATQ